MPGTHIRETRWTISPIRTIRKGQRIDPSRNYGPQFIFLLSFFFFPFVCHNHPAPFVPYSLLGFFLNRFEPKKQLSFSLNIARHLLFVSPLTESNFLRLIWLVPSASSWMVFLAFNPVSGFPWSSTSSWKYLSLASSFVCFNSALI